MNVYIDAGLKTEQTLSLEVGSTDSFPRTKTLFEGETTTIATIDFEATGSNPRIADAIECAIVTMKFDTESGALLGIEESASRLCEPPSPIDDTITALTGITNAMVAGKTLPNEWLTARLDAADIIVAHNASYDRTVCERRTGRRNDRWACTLHDIDWTGAQVLGRSLSALCASHGKVWPAHRAENDARAVAWLIAQRDRTRTDGKTIARTLIERASTPDLILVCATHGWPGEKAVANLRTCMRWAPEDKAWYRTERLENAAPEHVEARVDHWVKQIATQWEIGAILRWGTIKAEARHRAIERPKQLTDRWAWAHDRH